MGGKNFRALCKEYGISTKTGYKWKERYLNRGPFGVVEESRRPKSQPESLGERELCEMIRLKNAHPNWGPRKIRELYVRKHGQAASESSFKRVLERSGLTQKRKRKQVRESGRLSAGRRAQGPNEVWTVDFKGWWWNGMERCEPLSVRDEYSRYVLELRAVENARTETVRKHFESLFERHGLPEAIRSDNGNPFANVQAIYGLQPALGVVGGPRHRVRERAARAPAGQWSARAAASRHQRAAGRLWQGRTGQSGCVAPGV